MVVVVVTQVHSVRELQARQRVCLLVISYSSHDTQNQQKRTRYADNITWRSCRPRAACVLRGAHVSGDRAWKAQRLRRLRCSRCAMQSAGALAVHWSAMASWRECADVGRMQSSQLAGCSFLWLSARLNLHVWAPCWCCPEAASRVSVEHISVAQWQLMIAPGAKDVVYRTWRQGRRSQEYMHSQHATDVGHCSLACLFSLLG
jgi:hypothetical protein